MRIRNSALVLRINPILGRILNVEGRRHALAGGGCVTALSVETVDGLERSVLIGLGFEVEPLNGTIAALAGGTGHGVLGSIGDGGLGECTLAILVSWGVHIEERCRVVEEVVVAGQIDVVVVVVGIRVRQVEGDARQHFQ